MEVKEKLVNHHEVKMYKDILKNIPAVGAVFAASCMFAGMDHESRTSQLEQQMSQVRTQTGNKTYGANTAAGNPQVDGYGFDITLDVLYWRSTAENTVYSVTDQSSSVTLPWSGEMQEVNPDFDWGFRVGAGYNFDYDNWDAQAQFTYFNNTYGSTTNTGNVDVTNITRAPRFIISGTAVNPFYADTASSDYDMWFGNLDLQLGRSYYVSSDLSLRPFVGLQSAWIDINQKTTYSGGTVLQDNAVYANDESDFWGLGPEVGLGSKYHVGNGVSIFGSATGGLLYGRYNVVYTSWYSINTAGITQNLVKINGDQHGFAPNARLNLGLRYDTYMENNTQHFGIGLSYDTQYWFSQYRTLNVENRTRVERLYGDVAMQGITLDLRWDF